MPPQLDQARLAIDAFGLLVEGLEGRLGDDGTTLKDGLTQLRLAFVQMSEAGDAPPARRADAMTRPLWDKPRIPRRLLKWSGARPSSRACRTAHVFVGTGIDLHGPSLESDGLVDYLDGDVMTCPFEPESFGWSSPCRCSPTSEAAAVAVHGD